MTEPKLSYFKDQPSKSQSNEIKIFQCIITKLKIASMSENHVSNINFLKRVFIFEPFEQFYESMSRNTSSLLHPIHQLLPSNLQYLTCFTLFNSKS